MEIISDINHPALPPSVATIGFFDGVHLGHGALLRKTAERARELGVTPAAFTFDRSPKEFVTGVPVPLLTSAAERAEIIREYYGIGTVFVEPFDRAMMTMPWEDFITELLVKKYRAVHLVAGHDFRFGYKNQGDPEKLREKCRALGLGCDIIPKVELDGVKANVRTHETNLGDLITDALVWGAGKNGTKVDAAVTNGGGIRATIKKGDITKKDINTVLPFGNTLSIVKVTGAELLEALEASTYCTPDSIGGFPQVSGIVYTIDGTKTYDAGDVYEGSTYHAPKTIRRVTIQSVGGKAFNLRTVYTIATNDFLAAGGDTYYAFKTASVNYDLGIPMDEVVMDYVKTELKGVVSAENYGEAGDRITIIKGLPFTDVDPSAAYYSAVKYCYENNIFKGVTDTMFMPNNTITRGQMVTVLWRMNGSPEPKNANPFGDVAATAPFVKAIAWAAENKLTNGITEMTFAPAQAISRQQFLTILYRYAQFMGYDVSVGEDTNILSFEDVGEVGEYAIPAMQWAVGSGVLAAEKALTPRAAAPRYNVAEFLANFCMKVIPTAEMMPKAA